MKEVIDILKNHLNTEQRCFNDADKALLSGGLSNSDKNAFEQSKELAKKMIPNLEKAIEILRKHK